VVYPHEATFYEVFLKIFKFCWTKSWCLNKKTGK
jgi:hypothetical protein